MQQVWFAGNHSDLGGSYPENESRLSDLMLKWTLDFVTTELPDRRRLICNADMLHLFPSHEGMMHDECKSSRVRWAQAQRDVPPEAILHPTVLDRLRLPSAREHSGYAPYRPEQLRHYAVAGRFYADSREPASPRRLFEGMPVADVAVPGTAPAVAAMTCGVTAERSKATSRCR